MTEWITLEPRRGKRMVAKDRVTLSWRIAGEKKRERSYAAHITASVPLAASLGWPDKARVIVQYDPAGTMLRIAPGEGKMSRSWGQKHGIGTCQALLPWVRSEAREKCQVEFRREDGALIIILPDWARKAIEYPKGRAIPLREPEPPKPKAPPMPRWTPERIAYIRKHYTAGQAMPIIVATLNTMPGEVVTEPQVRGYASSVMMLSRPVSKAQRREPTMLDAAPPSARDELEAKVALRKGGKAREIAEEFGIGLGIVTRWADEVAAERERAA